MKNVFSTAIIATAFALLVPNNGAEAVGTMTASAPAASTPQQAFVGAARESDDAPDPSYGWIMGLGFLGFVATRRLRGD